MRPGWVVASVLLAVLGAYAATCASARITQSATRTSRWTWVTISATTMGLSLPCGVNYDPFITFASMLPGAVAMGVGWRRQSQVSTLIPATLLGAGIGAMHYTGMAAMRLDGFVRYDPLLFAVSVLVDMQMPVMDGVTAARRIRQSRSAEELPIVAMTANVLKADRDRCLDAGMNGYLTKPINPEALWKALRTWIKVRPGMGPVAAPSATPTRSRAWPATWAPVVCNMRLTGWRRPCATVLTTARCRNTAATLRNCSVI